MAKKEKELFNYRLHSSTVLTLQTFLRLIVIGAFPFLFVSKPTSIFSAFPLSATLFSCSSSNVSESSPSSSDELSSESASLSMITFGNVLLRVIGAICDNGKMKAKTQSTKTRENKRDNRTTQQYTTDFFSSWKKAVQ